MDRRIEDFYCISRREMIYYILWTELSRAGLAAISSPPCASCPLRCLTGARQTGKTTLTQAIEPARTYFTLDDVGILDQAERNPDSLLSTRPVILDEVQRAPQILLAVKRAVDTSRRAGDFILTGSANLLLMKQVAETLAGRAIYLDLPPFCPTEWQERTGALLPLDRLFAPDFDWREWPDEPGDWTAWLVRGGFPPALEINSEADRGLWFAAYVQTYLERDLRQLSAISSLPDFQRLMMLAAQRTGKLLNQADLARDAALSHPTAHRYLNLLETGCMITRIRPLATNPTAALVKAPKLLWTDCGLAAWLAGIRSSAEVATSMDADSGWSKPFFRRWRPGVRSIPGNANCITGATARGMKWISFWKKPASLWRWRSRRAVK